MPKGIKKRTAATVRAEMEKQAAAINDTRAAIKKAKEDYENKARQMRDDLKVKQPEVPRRQYQSGGDFTQHQLQDAVRGKRVSGAVRRGGQRV